MAFRYLHAKLSLLPRLFAPTIDALFSTIPLTHRWRLLLLQPINILSALITSPNWLFTNRYTVTYIPTRSGPRRCLVYQPLPRNSRTKTSKVKSSYRNPSLRPLHIDIHGGGFIGGFPELGARWLNTLSDATGAVIISCQYRIAPRYSYPAAHHDIDDIVTYILTHAQDFNADPNLVTVGGSSVGGSLAMSTSIEIRRRNLEIDSSLSTQQSLPEPKALLAFCPPTDYRLPAPLKPKPENFPKDPIPWVMPLYDTYPGPCRQIELWNKKLHPILAEREDLPERMFFVFAGIDILREEQRGFIERMCGSVGGGKGEEEEWQWEGEGEEQVKYGEGNGVEWVLFEKGFHGWLELPSSILESERLLAFTKAIAFIKNVHREHGFDVDNL